MKIIFILRCIFFVSLVSVEAAPSLQQVIPITISVDLRHPRVIADISKSFGAGIDGHEQGEVEKMLSPKNVSVMRKSGLKPLSYRLRTELGIEAWHWNPTGTWSNAAKKEGYWTSSTQSEKALLASYGYRLPRRGNTLDEANNDGYSRLDDGNPSTFWKSNPYLSSYYTGEPERTHPQWVMIDFGKPLFINAMRIHWGEPYAREFRIQWAKREGVCFGPHAAWHDFPKGQEARGQGGDAFIDLGEVKNFFGKREPVRCIRILMNKSSETGPSSSHDHRDRMGYAIREIEAGEKTSDGIFHDRVVHRPDHRQTVTYASSTDPWHRASDCDRKTEQPGFDFLMKSGLVQKSVLWAVPVLYDTPENAAAEISFLKQRGYLGDCLELGEEPDGQRIDPADFGALYGQVARAIHQITWGQSSNFEFLSHKASSQKIRNSMTDPMLGGPSFVTVDEQPHDITYRYDHRPWLRRFLAQLRRRHQEDDFQFLSFEWYPFDEITASPYKVLPRSNTMLQKAVRQLRHGGVLASIPLIISEYGYSVFEGRPEVELAAGLLNADIAAQFLLLGGETSYLYGYEPNHLQCVMDHSWGNLMMLLQNETEGIAAKLPTFYAAQLLTQEWTSSIKGSYQLYPTVCEPLLKNSEGYALLTAYMLHRPDNSWSLLVINKNPHQDYSLHCRFIGKSRQVSISWKPPFDKHSYSSAQYQWHANGAHGLPSLNNPPKYQRLDTRKSDTGILIRPWSISVIEANISR